MIVLLRSTNRKNIFFTLKKTNFPRGGSFNFYKFPSLNFSQVWQGEGGSSEVGKNSQVLPFFYFDGFPQSSSQLCQTAFQPSMLMCFLIGFERYVHTDTNIIKLYQYLLLVSVLVISAQHFIGLTLLIIFSRISRQK